MERVHVGDDVETLWDTCVTDAMQLTCGKTSYGNLTAGPEKNQSDVGFDVEGSCSTHEKKPLRHRMTRGHTLTRRGKHGQLCDVPAEVPRSGANVQPTMNPTERT